MLRKLSALVFAFVVTVAAAQPNPYQELRYCGPPARDASGTIIRSSSVLSAFQRAHPCPSTGLKSGSCPGWAKDHVVPLACGGCDAVYNLQWLPNAMKSAAGVIPKDRWERVVYADPTVYSGPGCSVK